MATERAFHIVMQGKGGVGKSTVSRFLAELLSDRGALPACFDLDAVNPSFSAVKALEVITSDIMDGDLIDPRKFDGVVDAVLETEGDVVVDCGASTFNPMLAYIDEIDLFTVLGNEGFDVHLHTVIAGGADLQDTTQGFATLAKRFGTAAQLVVWLNPKNGAIEMGGKPFEDWPVTRDNHKHLKGFVSLPVLGPRTAAVDLTEMLSKGLTFSEAIDAKSPLPAMARHRLRRVRDTIFSDIDTVLGIKAVPAIEAAE